MLKVVCQDQIPVIVVVYWNRCRYQEEVKSYKFGGKITTLTIEEIKIVLIKSGDFQNHVSIFPWDSNEMGCGSC